MGMTILVYHLQLHQLHLQMKLWDLDDPAQIWESSGSPGSNPQRHCSADYELDMSGLCGEEWASERFTQKV